MPRLSLCRVALRADLVRSAGGVPLDPLALLALAPAGAPRFYWSAPDRGEVIAAFGAAHTVTAEGADRLAVVARACATTAAQIAVAADGPAPAVPLLAPWLGGFAFEDGAPRDGAWAAFPAAAFTLPAVALVVRDGQAWLWVAGSTDGSALVAQARSLLEALAAVDRGQGTRTGVESGTAGSSRTDRSKAAAGVPASAAPAPADLRERITQVVGAIRRGEADKVVLATARTVAVPDPLDPLALVARLRALQPDCFHFMLAPRPGVAFLGASPERLVRVEGDRLTTMALAGSARRGADGAEDAALGQALLASPKDRAEHALVVAAIGEALRDYRVEIPAQPRLRRLANIQHLETPIRARLPGQGAVLAEVARLHPTPALGGTPRGAALGLIRRFEGIDRGWYGGGIGWIDGTGNGELAVAIRSLLLGPGSATAFAGAGLVAASEPDAEVAEIQLKLAAALTPLAAGVLSSA